MPSTSSLPRRCAAIIAAVALFGCDQIKASTDRAMLSLQMRASCPDPVEGRAAGADSPEAVMGCFRHAIANDSASMILRVTCKGRNAASCKQSDATLREAEKGMPQLKKQSWTTVIGKWDEGSGEKRVVVFAIDTAPNEKLVTTISTCKIVEGDKWAVCDIGELSRDAAEQKIKK